MNPGPEVEKASPTAIGEALGEARGDVEDTASTSDAQGAARLIPTAGQVNCARGDGPYKREVSLVRADGIKPQSIRWVWNGWLAAGKFHVLAGQPGTGKTTIALALAAVITQGGRWPDGTSVEPGNVLIWSGEDDPATTLVPRLLAMGADLSRVHFVGEVRDGRECRSFDPARDISALEHEAAATGGAKLLIVDPVVSAVGGDSHKNAETRRSLQPLVDLAGRLDCVVLGITHLTKGTSGREPIERVTGSLAFGAVARVVLIAAKLPDVPDGRILVRAKSNIGPDAGGFGYDFEQVELHDFHGVSASRILWRGALEGTARELLAEAEPSPPTTQGNERDQSMTDEAVDLLNLVLKDGPVLSNVVKQLATQACISPRALRGARKRLQVVVDREGFSADTKTYWKLPAPPFVPSIPTSAEENEVAQMDHEGMNEEAAEAVQRAEEAIEFG